MQVSKFEGGQDVVVEDSSENESTKLKKAKDNRQLTGLDHQLNEKVEEFKIAYQYKYD